jgi:Synergist-CTERM protein sorting domain-containing protein
MRDFGLRLAERGVTMHRDLVLARRFGGLLSVATNNVHSWVLAVGVLASGCMADEPELSSTESASTVGDFQSSGCSTAVVIGLSKQIADQAACMNPASFVSFEGATGITLTSNAALPYAVKGARDDLVAVAANNSLQINSALRSVAQQYLLYRWYQQGRCGITAAARVGTSNHEGGRAVDLANYSSRISAMAARGWAHDVAGDPVHFDHTSSPDDRGQDTKAFQVLWNKNHPGDTIAEDGAYGPQTEARLKQAPSTGFAIGPSCAGQHALDANVVSVQGPDRVPPATIAHYSITVKNSGQIDWPATTKLRLASGTSSPLHDDSWTSATVVTAIGAATPIGHTTTIELDVMTPQVDVETPVSQAFTLDDGGTKFGDISLALTVAPGADMGGESGEGNEGGDEAGGCNAGGNAGWLALALPAIVLRRRRRR